ncbi:FAD-dependent oxidoreductase [Pseudomonas sp. PA15(2017)]|uniref:FAD-dependent oxidoreductase n=1 Tax=Pseudomonas sp. PA15(2017) TaxID=1932111 RepID=UPI001C4656D4|nr:FAD-dependent oxidoreductase [Pseudomonas sp. PA15(2017)]
MTSSARPAGPKARDISVDVLIMGSGTGLAAALAAKEKGLSVLVVEKTELVGGSAARSGGAFWIPGNDALRRDGANTSAKLVKTYLDDLVGEDAKPARRAAYVEHGPAAVSMLERMTKLRFIWSKEYSHYHAERPGGSALGRTCESSPFDINQLGAEKKRFRPSAMGSSPISVPVTGTAYRWLNLIVRKPLQAIVIGFKSVILKGLGAMLLGKFHVASGQALAAGMFEGTIRANIPIWTRARVVELLSESGRVNGAVVEQDGQRFRVDAARGVILAAGGFDHNMAMRTKYQSPSLVEDLSLGAEGNTGDSINLAQESGAGIELMDQAWWFPSVKAVKGEAPKILLAERSLPGSIIVDQHGERFLNEAMDYMSFGQKLLQREQEGKPVGQMWLVFDQANRNGYMLAGSLMPRMSLPQAWYDEGIAVKADNPRDLARAAGLPEDRFVAAFERFNGNALQGKDEDFHRGEFAYDRYYGDPTIRPNPNVRPLTGTLYAIKLVLSDLGTCGGLMTDEHARVLREDETPIEGLYCNRQQRSQRVWSNLPRRWRHHWSRHHVRLHRRSGHGQPLAVPDAMRVDKSSSRCAA